MGSVKALHIEFLKHYSFAGGQLDTVIDKNRLSQAMVITESGPEGNAMLVTHSLLKIINIETSI